MIQNRNRSLTRFVVVISGILVASSFGCAKSSLKDISLFRSDKSVEAESLRENGENTKGKASSHATLTIWHESFEDAQAASVASGKPILADFTGSDWCHWCVKLKEDVFEEAEFKQWARDNVTLLELDYPQRSSQSPAIKKQNAELAKKYKISGYPTVLLLSPEGEVLGKLGYEKDPGTWIQLAEDILK